MIGTPTPRRLVSHPPRRVRDLAAALVAAFAVGQGVLAQDAGTLPQSVIAASTTLTDEQRTRIAEFVDALVSQLADEDAERVVRARNDLAAPPGRPGATEIFQREYAAAVRPAVAPLLKGEGSGSMRAVNAIIVLQALRTPEAVEAILDHIDAATEKRTSVRLRALSSIGDAARSAPMSPAQIDAATRRIVAAATREPDWLGVVHAFEALARIGSRPQLPEASATLALQGQADLMRTLVDRLKGSGEPSDAINAVGQGMVIIRDQIIDPSMPAARARDLRRRVAPSLGAIFEAAQRHWEGAHASAAMRDAYAGALRVAEPILQLAVRTDLQQDLATSLATAWQESEKSRFDAEVKKAVDAAARLGRAG